MGGARLPLAWCAASLLVALGFAPRPASLMPWLAGPPDAANIGALIFVLSLSPYLPLLLATLALVYQPVLSRATADALSIAAFTLGLFFTLAGTLFTGAGAVIFAVQGLCLTLAITASLHALAWPALGPHARRRVTAIMALPVLAALWSLAAIPVISLSARSIAAGAPYCITSHYRPHTMTSLWDLRGFSFYTTASGFKDTSHDYFHGLLIVHDPGIGDSGRRVHNWSPRHMRFDPITRPQNIGLSTEPTCAPL